MQLMGGRPGPTLRAGFAPTCVKRGRRGGQEEGGKVGREREEHRKKEQGVVKMRRRDVRAHSENFNRTKQRSFRERETQHQTADV